MPALPVDAHHTNAGTSLPSSLTGDICANPITIPLLLMVLLLPKWPHKKKRKKHEQQTGGGSGGSTPANERSEQAK
jgi:hypothetical protein